jgi:hypothetical protein
LPPLGCRVATLLAMTETVRANGRWYETYIAGEVLFSQLDRNPFTPLAVQKTLTVSLAALAKAVH